MHYRPWESCLLKDGYLNKRLLKHKESEIHVSIETRNVVNQTGSTANLFEKVSASESILIYDMIVTEPLLVTLIH